MYSCRRTAQLCQIKNCLNRHISRRNNRTLPTYRSSLGISVPTFDAVLIEPKKQPNLNIPKVAIVGAGPAGLFTAEQLLKDKLIRDARSTDRELTVDFYEKMPMPFGMARYGVAPDHIQTKNAVGQTFGRVLKDPRVSFFGNVNVGTDISIQQLLQNYTAVVLAYGMSEENKLDIPGENVPGVVHASRFSGWYNGFPRDQDLTLPDLSSVDTVAVIGQNHTAVDVARILLTDVDMLKSTDITEQALEALSGSRVTKVKMISHTGPLHTRCTIPELKELINLKNCRPDLDYPHLQIGNINEELLTSTHLTRWRMLRDIAQYRIDVGCPAWVEDIASESWCGAGKEWSFVWWRQIQEILTNKDSTSVAGIGLGINKAQHVVPWYCDVRLQEEWEDKTWRRQEQLLTAGTYDALDGQPAPTGETEVLPCQLIINCTGFTGLPIEKELPWNEATHRIEVDVNGRVEGVPGLYACGWCKSGPRVSLLGLTEVSAINTATAIRTDINKDMSPYHIVPHHEQRGSEAIEEVLSDKGVRVVQYEDWRKLDTYEIRRGKAVGKCRQKITKQQEFMDVLDMNCETYKAAVRLSPEEDLDEVLAVDREARWNVKSKKLGYGVQTPPSEELVRRSKLEEMRSQNMDIYDELFSEKEHDHETASDRMPSHVDFNTNWYKSRAYDSDRYKYSDVSQQEE